MSIEEEPFCWILTTARLAECDGLNELSSAKDVDWNPSLEYNKESNSATSCYGWRNVVEEVGVLTSLVRSKEQQVLG